MKTTTMDAAARVYLAGHRGLAGAAIHRALERRGFTNLVLRTSAEADLRDQAQVEDLFADEKPEYVFLAAARVGGIAANLAYPADFIRDNLLIQTNVIDAAWRHGVKKLLFLGSSCAYPRDCSQPMGEDALLGGPLEASNEPYALAKIAGISMCQSYNRQYGTRFISAMPTNLYGPGDTFDLENSHVLPALIRKFHEALPSRPVAVWGTGLPKREFLHADDLADACLHLMDHYEGDTPINVGTGQDLTIRELAQTVQKIVGHQGELFWDTSRPDGTYRKLLNTDRLHALGWQAQISLEEGIRDTYQWFLSTLQEASW